MFWEVLLKAQRPGAPSNPAATCHNAPGEQGAFMTDYDNYIPPGEFSMPRRFPPPWTVEETDACFIVRDHNGQAPGEQGPSRSVRDEPGCRNEKLKRRLYCVARADRRAGKSPVMFGF